MFELDPRIAEDSALLGPLPLCQARLHRDARYPWVRLVPARPAIREIHTMDPTDRAQLLDEVVAVSAAMESALGAEKMNVAALGNICPQLHMHVVARYAADDAWPGPIWGVHPPLEYIGEAWQTRVALLTKAFAPIKGFTAA
ncbi:MAG: HIT domain-containing protein [Sandaracinaceae bacterium]